MNTSQKISLFILRISLGGLFFYSGITKVLDPKWSAEGYISAAKTFPELYAWFLGPGILPIVNLLNQWGLLLIGLALFIGIFTRISAFLGVVLMLLYYFAVLDFPHPSATTYIVDQHIIYIGALLVIASFRAGRAFGLDGKMGR